MEWFRRGDYALNDKTNERSKTAHGAADETVQLFVQLLKLSSLISGPMQDGVAAPNKMGLNEIKIMMCLGGEGALAGHDITDIMAIPQMNVSRALAVMAERGWIERTTDIRDHRRKPVQLSVKGWEAHDMMTPDIEAVSGYVLGKLTPSERAALSKTVFKIIDRMADWFDQYHVNGRLKHPG
jgi:DNA-binding MarR family transcriptional regulator